MKSADGSQSEQRAVGRFHLAAHARALAVLVLLVAAAEAVLVRLDHPHHGTEAALFVHAVLLWSAFGLAALVPALFVARLAQPIDSERGCGHACRLAFFLLAPVLAHHVLDRHTAIGQNVRALFAPRPWLEVALVLGAAALALALAARLLRRVRRTPLALASSVLALGAGFFAPLDFEARDPRPELRTPDGAAERPNVLLLVWDTTRADHLSPYGYERATTPALADLARQSLVFEDARSVSIFTFTSHVSMLTGKYPAATGARLHRMRLDPKLARSVAETFADAGWRTGAFVGTWVLSGTTGIQRGFEVYDDRVDPDVALTYAWKLVHDVQAVLADKLGIAKSNGQPHWFQDFQRPAGDVLARALAWIREPDPRPWFCMVNLYDVHWPYVPSAESRERFVGPYDGPMDGYLFRSNGYPPGHVPTDEDQRHLRELYDAEMWQLDREVDRFLAALELERSNTAVVVVADHGEAFGEAGRFEHDDILEPQVRIPLLVRLPGPAPLSGPRAGRACGVDVAPTLLGLAGLAVPDDLHGVDLVRAELAPEREILVEDRDHEGVDDVRLALYSEHWKLVRRGLGERATHELYDLAADPDGEVDVAAAHKDVVLALAQRLDELRAGWADLDLGLDLDGPSGTSDALGGLGYLDGAGGAEPAPPPHAD